MARRTHAHAFFLLCRLSLAIFAALVAVSCASGDVASGQSAFDEEPTATMQQAITCLCGTCTPTACMDFTCGTGRECCIARPKKDGTSCAPAKGETGFCLSGECCAGCAQVLKDGTVLCQPGTQPAACGAPGGECASCNDGNPCTEDSCDSRGSGRCSSTILPDETACPSGTCWGGSCCRGCIDEKGVCQAGNMPDACGLGGGKCAPCNDGNLCTDDACSAGKCVNPSRPDGASCETDSNVCNGTSTCRAGKCGAGSTPDCDDNNPCTNDTCDPVLGCQFVNNTISCTDGNPCTTGDACSGGSCKPGPAVVCNDNEFCTNDTCNPQTGCVYTPKANGATCDDGSACTPTSSCTAGKCVGPVGGFSCDDMDPCTKNGCTVNGTTMLCNYAQLEPVNTPCLGPDKCLVNTTCDAQGVCSGGVQKDCNDNNPCTDDTCDPETGGCVNAALDTGTCSDGSSCTLNDSCRDGECTGDPVECAPLDDCHVGGTCNDATGVCDDPRAEDGTPCAAETGTCTAGKCVITPIPPEGGAGGEGSTPEGGSSNGGSAGAVGDAGSAGETTSGGTGAGGRVTDSGGTGNSAGGTTSTRGGSEDESERGPTFSRKPGGCDCSVPKNDASSNALLLLAMSGFGVAWVRRRNQRRASI